MKKSNVTTMGEDPFAKAFVAGENLAEFRCECLVVGSGAGGALTASFLAERGKEVLIVEEGSYIRPEDKSCSIMSSFPQMWREGGAIPIMSNTSFVFGEGRTLGGSTAINSGLINRISEEVVEKWKEDYDVHDLDFNAITKCQDMIERVLDARVIDGERNRAGDILKLGAAKCGFKGAYVPVAGDPRSGNKHTVQKTFLAKAAEHGAKILTDCRIDRIVFKNQKAIGASGTLVRNGMRRRIKIKFDKLFVCAGTIQSSLLLRRSGIKKNIGDSVQFHPTFRVIAEFDEPLNIFSSGMSSFQIKEFAPNITMGASITTPAFIASGLSINWVENKEALRRIGNMAIYYVGIKSNARGTARNLPFLENSYMVRYNLNNEDFKTIHFGYEKLSQILFAGGAKRLYPSLRGIASVEKDSSISSDEFTGNRLNLVSIHSYSSCPMGEKRSLAAIDSFGKLHDYENVYVHDASILPTSPGVNPQGPIMTMVLRSLEHNFG